MADAKLASRIRRLYRKRQRQVEEFSVQAGEQLDEHVINRLDRLIHVRRFVATWVGLLLMIAVILVVQVRSLAGYYQTPAFVPGGTYSEGILGDFTTANPIYATGPVDTAVSRLIFAGLFDYNDQNQLTGELAQNWQVDATGKVYTVHLKPHLTWQDGQPLTANDVVYTYQLIQNPDVQSPLATSWQNVSVTAIDPLTVQFTLTSGLASFPYSLTNGIVPEHILSSIAPTGLRTANFNTTDPIGAGPFAFRSLESEGDSPQTRQEEVTLTPFKHYTDGAPKLDAFVVRAIHDQNNLITSFKNQDLNGIAGLTSVPDQLSSANWLQSYSLPLTAANMVFFKTSSGILSDASVRQALVQGANVNSIIQQLNFPVSSVREPLLNNQLGFNASDEQLPYNPAAAAALLQTDGWILGTNGVRAKAGQELTFSLYAEDTPDSQLVTNALRTEWRKVGVNTEVILQDQGSFQDTVTFHTYDALLYGISIGVDPDIFVYWGSAQANPSSETPLNFSEYKSTTADASLEAGRTRTDPALRVIKYEPFLQAWQEDAPALGLYQPRFLYLTHQPVGGLTEHTINDATDRYDNVQNWEIRTANVGD